ncbi:MAG TPA: DUF1836 domain-containing protein [Oscillospiraceae bacterium]|nr:DUF1836 domain-containing protein [Oscillospiraceae bacterium]
MDNDRMAHCPRWAELPSLGLYMDQVLLVLTEALAPVTAGDQVTATMVGNYVKMKLVRPSEKKKYAREHLARLIMISLFKHVLSMAEIARVLEALTADRAIGEAYDLFCARLEALLASPAAPPEEDGLPLLPAAAVRTLADKLVFERMLAEE